MRLWIRSRHRLALQVTPGDELNRALDGELARQVQQIAFAWAARFRRTARGYERLATTLGTFHFLAFACPMIAQLFGLLA